MYQYPYGNAQQLNLDWILGKLQELEAGSGGGDADLEEVANVLISASFDAGVSYRRYDYCFYNGKLYRALNDTTGAFNPADWLEVVIGDDIPVLTRLLNAVDASLTTLQGQVENLDSDDVDNASSVVSGVTVTNALETLDDAISDEHDRVTYAFEISAYYETSNIAQLRSYAAGDYVIINDRLWKLTDAVPQGSSFIGHITRVVLGNEVASALSNANTALSNANTALTETTPVARGGTGQTTVADAKNAFGIPNLRVSSKPVPRQETTILNIGSNARGMLFIPPQGFYIVSSSSGGAVDITEVAAVTNVTITAGTYQLTVVSNSTANFVAYYLDFENIAIS